MPTISPETVIVRRAEPLTAAVDDDLVMLDLHQGRYFGLDRIGRRIWELLEQPRSVEDLCRSLVDDFDVEVETCHAEVTPFLEQLAEAQLIETR